MAVQGQARGLGQGLSRGGRRSEQDGMGGRRPCQSVWSVDLVQRNFDLLFARGATARVVGEGIVERQEKVAAHARCRSDAVRQGQRARENPVAALRFEDSMTQNIGMAALPGDSGLHQEVGRGIAQTVPLPQAVQ